MATILRIIDGRIALERRIDSDFSQLLYLTSEKSDYVPKTNKVPSDDVKLLRSAQRLLQRAFATLTKLPSFARPS